MEIYILEIFDLKSFNNKLFKNRVSQLSYIFLAYIYYKKFGKVLKFKNILKTEYGKPYLKSNEFHFNISHSKSYICIGINNSKIGVDIEEYRRINQNALKKFLTKDEILCDKISSLQYWVIKEAYSKYIGKGLHLDFKTITLDYLKKSNLYVFQKNNDKFIYCAISKNELRQTFFIDKSEIKGEIKWLSYILNMEL